MRKSIILFFSMIILISSLTIGANASYNKELESKANILYMESLDNGTVIFNKNSNIKTAPASLTKMVTALVVIDKCKNYDEVIVTPRVVIRSLDGTNSSNAAIKVGEELTVDELMHLMLVKSANDAAAILAYHFGGDNTENFIKDMNAYAKKIGCKNTHFENPHGLDEEGHYTTAEDLAKITKHGLKNKKFKELTSTLIYYLPPTNKRPEKTRFATTNMLVSPHAPHHYYYKYAKGVKTGTTDNAGACLISTATKNGYSYICVAMQAPIGGKTYKDYNFAFAESKNAYKWTFQNIKLKVVADPTDVVTDVKVDLSKKVDHVRLIPKEEVSALVPAKVDSTGILIEPIKESIPKNVQAPIEKGEKIGKARVMYAGEKICEIDLVAGDSVKRSYTKFIGYLFKKIFKSTIGKIVSILVILFLIFYIVVSVMYHKKKKRKRNRFYVVDNTRNIRR